MRRGLEKCANCGLIHYINQSPAVYIGGQYYCRPSCHRRYHETKKEISNADGTTRIAAPHGSGICGRD